MSKITKQELDGNCASLASVVAQSMPNEISALIIFVNRSTGHVAVEAARMDSQLAHKTLRTVLDKINESKSLIITARG